MIESKQVLPGGGTGKAPMIRVIFLDIDDTLLSFSGYVKEAMREGFARFGLKPYTEEMFPVFDRINRGFWRQIEDGTLTFPELQKIRWNTVFAALGIKADGPAFETWFRERLFTSAVPEPGAVELLEQLAPAYRLCIASNGPSAQQRSRLRLGGLTKYFSGIFLSSELGARKPEPAFYDAVFEILRRDGLPDLVPEQTLMIGDSMHSDILGGVRYGMHTCLYQKYDMPETDTSAAEYVVTDLRQIPALLNAPDAGRKMSQ